MSTTDATAQTTAAAAEDRPPYEERAHTAARLAAAKTRITAARKRMAKAIIALADAVQETPDAGWNDRQHETWLQNECGMTSDDIVLFRNFDHCLGKQRRLVVARLLSFDTVKALAGADSRTRAIAFDQIDEGVPLGRREIARIRRASANVARTDEEQRLLLRKRHISSIVKARGSELVGAVEKPALDLFEKLRSFQQDYFGGPLLAPRALREEECEEDLPAPCDFAGYDHRHQEIAVAAAALATPFRELFGAEHPAVQNWHRLPRAKPELLEMAMAKEAITRLTCGRFGRGFGFDFVGERDPSSPEILSAIAYLAGTPLGLPGRDRLKANPSTTLTALELCAGAGGAAIGLMSAGFSAIGLFEKNPSAFNTLRANWPAWNVLKEDLNSDKARRSIEGFAKKRFDLLAAGTPCTPFSTLGDRRGEADEKQLFDRTKDFIEISRPKAFYFENVPGFLEARHLPLRSRLTAEFADMGYNLYTFSMKATDYGLAQNRKRVIVAGISKTEDHGFVVPSPQRKKRVNLRNAIGDLVEEYMHELVSRSSNEDARAQAALVRSWKDWWFDQFGAMTTPTLTTMIKKGQPRELANWKRYGFDRDLKGGDDETFVSTTALIPLTVPILKRLQGLPDNWTIVGGRDGQIRQIANAFPPQMAKAVALSIRAAITGDYVDLDAELSRRVIDDWRIGRGFALEKTKKPRGRPRKQVIPPKPDPSAYALWDMPSGRGTARGINPKVVAAKRAIRAYHSAVEGRRPLRWRPLEAGPDPWGGPWNARMREAQEIDDWEPYDE